MASLEEQIEELRGEVERMQRRFSTLRDDVNSVQAEASANTRMVTKVMGVVNEMLKAWTAPIGEKHDQES